MRRIPASIGPALALLVVGCGSPQPPGTPEPPPSLSTGAATTASAGAPPVHSAASTTATGPADPVSRTSGSTTAKPTTGKPPTPPKITTAKPPAKGSPVRTAPIDIIGTSYAALGPVTEAQLADECGGTLCVTLGTTVEGPPDPKQDCTVKRIIQSVPIYRGDTITFVLSDPCGDFTPPPEPTE
ncbi:hypothetical protein ACWEGE_02140 [Amycolatopsis sp. NPDC004747]